MGARWHLEWLSPAAATGLCRDDIIKCLQLNRTPLGSSGCSFEFAEIYRFHSDCDFQLRILR